MKPFSIKEKAINYRKRGYSYNMISERFGLAKGTLSDWLREIPYKPNEEVIRRIKAGPAKAAELQHNKKVMDIIMMKKLARKEFGKLTKRDLWLLGLGLYLGEGSKLYEIIEVVNSDPEIIKIAMKWFREICGFSDKNFAPSVHIYPDNDIQKTIKYWSKITGVSKTQFRKTQIDRRLNKSRKMKRKLPYGTLHLRVKSCGKKEFGRSLHRRIMGWIEAISNQI